jgi:hypothetical protein
VPAHNNVRFSAEHCLFEFQGDVFTQIGPALGTAAPSRTAAEKISEAEKVAEDLADILENCGVESPRSSAAYRSMSEPVVRGPLVRVGQDRIGLTAFLEFFFGVGVVRIAIRMELQRQLAIGALDLLLVSFSGNSEDFVVVAFYVASQNSSKSFRVWCVLVFRVARNSDHRGTHQAVFQLVAALQFFQYLMIWGVGGIHHLNRLVKVGIEGFTPGRDGTKS